MSVTSYCLDQGAFRSPALVHLINSDYDAVFVVPDSAIMEMCKSERWEYTARRSLKHLAAVPDRVLFALGHGECFRKEIESKRPATFRDLICPNQTLWFRELLTEVVRGDSDKCFDAMAARIKNVQADLKVTSLNHVQNFSDIRKLIDTIDANLRPEYKRRLRASQVPRQEYLTLVSAVLPQALSTWSRSAGYSPEQFQNLLAAKSFIVRFMWLRVRACFDWIARGGIESVDPAKITNSDVDRQYLVVGSYCGTLLSCDNDVKHLDQDLRDMLVGKV